MAIERQSGDYSMRIIDDIDHITIFCRNVVAHEIYYHIRKSDDSQKNFKKVLLSPHTNYLLKFAKYNYTLEVSYDFDGFYFKFIIPLQKIDGNEIDTKQFDKYLQTIAPKINMGIAYFGFLSPANLSFEDYEYNNHIVEMEEKFLKITNIPICQAKHYPGLDKYYNFYFTILNTIKQHEKSNAMGNLIVEKSNEIKIAVILSIENHPALNNDTLMKKLLSQKSLKQVIDDLKTEIGKTIVEQMQDKTFIYIHPEFVFGNELEVYVKIGKRTIEWNQSNYVEYMQKIIDERFDSSDIANKLGMYESANANEEPSIDLGKYREIMKLYLFTGGKCEGAEFNVLKDINKNFTKKRITELFLNGNNNKIELCCAEGGVYTPEQKFVIDALDEFYDKNYIPFAK